ncbi:MAG: phosphate acyltransferase PlsX [Parasporobacterium sp.]|nr:phosphate acyltransferase PlsX [Parasporobacterium sp.]
MEDERKITIAVDAMGGDFAPAETVKGAVLAVKSDNNLCVTLFGVEDQVQEELKKYSYDAERIQVTNAPSVIETCEPPVNAIKTKKDSSMVMALYAVKKGEADAAVSCGNTGALLVGGQLIVGRIRGIERAALAFLVPSLKEPVMLIDAGANVDCRSTMLVQFAQMGSIYMEDVVLRKNPKVGLLNIGEEEEKGNAQVKATVPLLKECETINFVGSVQSREMTEGDVDIIVCDGFVGNTILKTYEGVSSAIIQKLKGSLKEGRLRTKIGAGMIKKDLKEMLKEFSVEEYGGAPMLGLKNLVVKTHGNSKGVEIRNAILQCRDFVAAEIAEKITKSLAE